ncbi:hypothetical protein BU26DRAFT_292908 [Trematosphaeria pertusa]|uniref:Uncharacterized protein n=1 Tax=Trematosphaeria pertusa TaxID=390896 RepID=A0A6A6IIR4_9PLEO|nr:uncharacterized protein BU26DRAFT_292908 [Trematosphaeria pertusa]KAF2249938.1 hypothetical protein BU26DRAFT_292908 [Trematosphaeria pertusa]
MADEQPNNTHEDDVEVMDQLLRRIDELGEELKDARKQEEILQHHVADLENEVGELRANNNALPLGRTPPNNTGSPSNCVMCGAPLATSAPPASAPPDIQREVKDLRRQVADLQRDLAELHAKRNRCSEKLQTCHENELENESKIDFMEGHIEYLQDRVREEEKKRKALEQQHDDDCEKRCRELKRRLQVLVNGIQVHGEAVRLAAMEALADLPDCGGGDASEGEERVEAQDGHAQDDGHELHEDEDDSPSHSDDDSEYTVTDPPTISAEREEDPAQTSATNNTGDPPNPEYADQEPPFDNFDLYCDADGRALPETPVPFVRRDSQDVAAHSSSSSSPAHVAETTASNRDEDAGSGQRIASLDPLSDSAEGRSAAAETENENHGAVPVSSQDSRDDEVMRLAQEFGGEDAIVQVLSSWRPNEGDDGEGALRQGTEVDDGGNNEGGRGSGEEEKGGHKRW